MPRANHAALEPLSAASLLTPHKRISCAYHCSMTTYFVSRHPGAIEWAAGQNLRIDHFDPHLDLAQVQAGDTVIGSLPVNLAARVCAAGAAYWHISLALPAELRGRELSAEELRTLGAKIEPFEVLPATRHQSSLRRAST